MSDNENQDKKDETTEKKAEDSGQNAENKNESQTLGLPATAEGRKSGRKSTGISKALQQKMITKKAFMKFAQYRKEDVGSGVPNNL